MVVVVGTVVVVLVVVGQVLVEEFAKVFAKLGPS